MRRYEERLAAYQAVDFDDLVVLPLKLLQRDAEVRDAWRDRLRHLLVDEYQDTNARPVRAAEAAAPASAALFTAVGDDDQSIYGWRGATIDNLRRLPLDYPQLKVIALEQNYRSTGSILRAANAVIANNPKLFEKKLWSDFGDGDPVRDPRMRRRGARGRARVARIQSLRGSGGGAEVSDFAVLYRANHQARVFEQALRKAGIAYKVSGGQSFFDRAEIHDLCAWLRLIVNHDDDPAFLRAVTSPKRGIGHQTLAALGTSPSRWKASLFEALFAESLMAAAARAGASTALHEFGRCVNDLEDRAGATTGERRRAGAAARLAEGHRLRAAPARRRRQRRRSPPRAGATCSTSSTGSRAAAAARARPRPATRSAATSVLAVAQTISVIISLAERGDDQDVVTLSTLHAAKGLEWPHVVLAASTKACCRSRAATTRMAPRRASRKSAG